MEHFVVWISDNKEWLFSGIGLAVVGGVCRIIFKKNLVSSSTQTIRSGDHSTNFQAGRDLSFDAKKRNDLED